MGWVPFYFYFKTMSKNQLILKTIFCKELASWLQHEEWHFTTILARCIEVTKPLPENISIVISELLLHYPTKTSKQNIINYLNQRSEVNYWFHHCAIAPKVVLFNLISDVTIKTNSNLPYLVNNKDIASWLNVSISQLEWLCDFKRYNPRSPNHLRHYHYSLQKKRNGAYRLIESPKSNLKSIQRKITDDILSHCKMSNSAHGFIKGRNCQTHATLHVNKHYLFIFDIANCFLSIQWKQVYAVFRQLGYNQEVSRYLCALCTHRSHLNEQLSQSLTVTAKLAVNERHLPQGSPSSPALSNAVLFHLDNRLCGLANRLNLSYSRYADDLAFSGNHHRNWHFFESLVGSICLEEGFDLNYRKSRLLKPHQKQQITGIVVNEKININRRKYDQIKAILINCQRHGLQSQNHENHPNFKEYLFGHIQYVKSLNKSKGKKLEAIYYGI